jgi:hypothetical protein
MPARQILPDGVVLSDISGRIVGDSYKAQIDTAAPVTP